MVKKHLKNLMLCIQKVFNIYFLPDCALLFEILQLLAGVSPHPISTTDIVVIVISKPGYNYYDMINEIVP